MHSPIRRHESHSISAARSQSIPGITAPQQQWPVRLNERTSALFDHLTVSAAQPAECSAAFPTIPQPSELMGFVIGASREPSPSTDHPLDEFTESLIQATANSLFAKNGLTLEGKGFR
jgi:hypothetical protein